MRLVPHPIGLVPRMIKPTSGPVLLSAPTGMTKFVQSIMAPTALFGIDVEYPIKRESQARAVAGMILDLEGGANVLRFPYRDAHEPKRHEFGLSYGEWNDVPWSNGLPWGNGKNWRTSPPTTVAMVDAEFDAVEVIVSIAAWPFTLKGTRFGFAGHWGVYTVQDAVVSGSVATLWIWPGLRRRVTAGTIVTLRPTVGIRLVGPDAGTFSDTIQGRSDITLSLIEVPDETIRTYASEHRPSPTYSFDPNPWYLSTSLRTLDGHMPVEVLEFDEDRYALPYGLTAADVATASVVRLATLTAATFAEGFTLSATSSGTARTYVTEALGIGTDIAVDAPRFDWLPDISGDTPVRRLLLEPAQTALMIRSEEAGSWSTNASPNDTSVTADAVMAPDGTTTADLVIPGTSSGAHIRYQTFTGAISTRFVYERMFKADGYSHAILGLENTGFASVAKRAVYALSGAGSVTATQNSPAATRIDAFGDGWYRCRIEVDSDADGGAYVSTYYPASGPAIANITMAGDGTSGVYVWGGGICAGKGEVSYIATGAGTVTRAIETAQETALALALASRSAWTGVITFTPHQVDDGVIYQADDGTTNNRIMVSVTAGVVSLSVRAGGVSVFLASATTPIVAGTEATIAWRCKSGRNRISVGGGGMETPSTDTGGALPVGLTQSSIARNMAGTLRYAAGRYRRHIKYAAAVSDEAVDDLSVGPA